MQQYFQMSGSDLRPRVAIVGGGVSGLATSWLLGKSCHVTMFERRTALGLGAEGVDVSTATGTARVDIPPRVFNSGHYRALSALLEEVGMPTYPIEQRPVFTNQDGQPYLGFETIRRGSRVRHRVRLHRSTWRWLGRHGAELYRWHRVLMQLDLNTIDAGESLVHALTRLGVSDRFRDSFLYPMWSLMCTCTFEQLDAFPAAPVLRLARNFAGDRPTLRLDGGTRALEDRLQQRIASTALARTVQAVEPQSERVVVRTREDDRAQVFDHVVLATDPHSTLQLLQGRQWDAERSLIAKVPLHKTQMVLHADASMLCGSMRAPVTLHYDAERRRSSATLWMNPVEKEQLTDTLIQSWDPMTRPADKSIRAQRTFYRALMSGASQRAMAQLRMRMQHDTERRVWFVGSYVEDGVPLLENGVRSAQRVAGLVGTRLEQAAPARTAQFA